MKAYMVEIKGCGQVKSLRVFDSMEEAKEELAHMGFHRVACKGRMYVGWVTRRDGHHEHRAYYLNTQDEWDRLIGIAYHI